jgi:hypothetical protein
VLDAAGDDEQFPRPEHHIAVSHLNSELSVQDQEELIGVGVRCQVDSPWSFTILTS